MAIFSFIFAFVIAAMVNVSAFDIVAYLWRQPTDLKILSLIKPEDDRDTFMSVVTVLSEMPFGWPPNSVPGSRVSRNAVAPAEGPIGNSNDIFMMHSTSLPAFLDRSPMDWDYLRISGWLVTAIATMVGAPFWLKTLRGLFHFKESSKVTDERDAVSAAG